MYSQIAENKRRTFLLFFFFAVFVIGIGWGLSYYFNDQAILVYAIIIAVIQSWVSYFASDSIALAVAGAHQADPTQFSDLHHIVENLAITSGLPKPRVFVIDDPAPNAFATGRDPKHAAIAVTTGLLQLLNHRELEGVIAHELSHVGNRDTLVMTVAVTLVGIIVLISDIFLRSLWWRGRDDERNEGGQIVMIIAIVLAILTPIFAKLIQLAISRQREYEADASGALLTRFPEGLAEALKKIEAYERPMKNVNRATAHLYINEPYGIPEKREKSWLVSIFSTHPPIEDRIHRLESM
jgi:heat shock protein HtpX